MANASILAAFERMWQYTVALISNKANLEHDHNDMYYTESEIDSKLDNKADAEHTHDNYVSIDRKINGKELSSDIVLTALDVGALPDTTEIPDALSDLTDDVDHRTVTDVEKEAWHSKAQIQIITWGADD
jgi:hypothetical protein